MSLEIDQDIAKKLLDEGGTLVFLGVPEGTEFGIDMKSWNTAEDFRGVKMIPPGLHFIHYSSVNKSTGDVSPRAGFMHHFKPKEFVVRMWDKEKEAMGKDEISDESLQRLKDNLYNLDSYLAPYPYEIWITWKDLSAQVTGELVKRLTPENGEIQSAVEFLSCDDKDRPRGVKRSEKKESIENKDPSSNITTEEMKLEKQFDSDINDIDMTQTCSTSQQENNDCQQSSENKGLPLKKRKNKPITDEEKEEAMLPHLEPVPGTALRLTEFPELNYPPGSSASEITKHSLDQTWLLETMIKQHNSPLDLIGEMQFTFICFLIGHSLDAFEHWKKIVTLFCSCEEAIKNHRNLYFHFIKTLDLHITETPEGFLADIVMNKNLVYKKLRDLFRTIMNCEIESRLKSIMERFKIHLTEKFMWDFSHLDEEDDDEKPVVVSLPE